MKNNVIAWVIGALAFLALLIMTSVTESPVAPAAPHGASNDINLALREIADHILREENDFTTIIPPIRKEAEGTYLIKLSAHIDYFALRPTVDRILKRHGIQPDYRLSLLNCESGSVELGFLARAFDEDKEVPCQERVQNTTCYNLRLALINNNDTIAGNQPIDPMKRLQWLVLGLALSFPVIWLFWKRQAPENEAETDDGWFVMSDHTRFHPGNQLLQINEASLDLTFREAKLLQFLLEHQNQVLERERIMESVWEDEGVIVGRSLDVFVSRLRKKLKADPGLQITNVHGVGYKLMI